MSRHNTTITIEIAATQLGRRRASSYPGAQLGRGY
jgi:hypothetical protein